MRPFARAWRTTTPPPRRLSFPTWRSSTTPRTSGRCPNPGRPPSPSRCTSRWRAGPSRRLRFARSGAPTRSIDSSSRIGAPTSTSISSRRASTRKTWRRSSRTCCTRCSRTRRCEGGWRTSRTRSCPCTSRRGAAGRRGISSRSCVPRGTTSAGTLRGTTTASGWWIPNVQRVPSRGLPSRGVPSRGLPRDPRAGPYPPPGLPRGPRPRSATRRTEP
mmetsp:Transcript_5910/g.24212  ORF Transcript_5910/g.24212 Transcript_5910/m.24212 type:complete len:217 (+) Transcript_5910:4713-5363(+)